MNIQAERHGIVKDTCNDGKNPSKKDDKKPTVKTSPLEKSSPVNRNDNLKDYGEPDVDNNLGRRKEWKKKANKMKEVIYIEFNTDYDMEVQPKNANDGNGEEKVRVKKKMVHYFEFSSEDESRKQADPNKFRKAKMTTKNQEKMMNLTRLLSPRK